jgi:lipoprotein-releasing system ATP-binding protein
MSVAVYASGVTKTYQDGVRRVEVLRGIDLAVAPGEMVAIVGPSGSGKSTLLHLLGALDRPDMGTVEVGGHSLAGLSGAELAGFRNRTIGFVFQFHQLLPDFTALENVMLPGRIAGREPRGVLANARRLLEEVGLAERLEHFPNQLSGGERQRVGVARALAARPSIVLMDEPFGALDPLTRDAIGRDFRGLHETLGLTTVLITHDMLEAVLLADEPTGNLDPASGDAVFQLLLDLQARHRTTGVLVTHNPEIAQRCTRTLRLDGGVLQPY